MTWQQNICSDTNICAFLIKLKIRIMDFGKNPCFVTMVPHLFYKHTHTHMYHHSWELTNALSAFACFRLRAATLCSVICCDWQTHVLTCTHTHTAHTTFLFSLSREHRCLLQHLFCISCYAISRLWKPSWNIFLMQEPFMSQFLSDQWGDYVNAEYCKWSGNLGWHELGLTLQCV